MSLLIATLQQTHRRIDECLAEEGAEEVRRDWDGTVAVLKTVGEEEKEEYEEMNLDEGLNEMMMLTRPVLVEEMINVSAFPGIGIYSMRRGMDKKCLVKKIMDPTFQQSYNKSINLLYKSNNNNSNKSYTLKNVGKVQTKKEIQIDLERVPKLNDIEKSIFNSIQDIEKTIQDENQENKSILPHLIILLKSSSVMNCILSNKLLYKSYEVEEWKNKWNYIGSSKLKTWYWYLSSIPKRLFNTLIWFNQSPATNLKSLINNNIKGISNRIIEKELYNNIKSCQDWINFFKKTIQNIYSLEISQFFKYELNHNINELINIRNLYCSSLGKLYIYDDPSLFDFKDIFNNNRKLNKVLELYINPLSMIIERNSVSLTKIESIKEFEEFKVQYHKEIINCNDYKIIIKFWLNYLHHLLSYLKLLINEDNNNYRKNKKSILSLFKTKKQIEYYNEDNKEIKLSEEVPFKSVNKYQPPKKIESNWMKWTMSIGLIYVLWKQFTIEDVIRWTKESKETIKDFIRMWIIKPLEGIYNTVRHKESLAIIGTESLQGDIDSLERMVVDFAIDMGVQDKDVLELIKEETSKGRMDIVMESFEKDIKNPIKSLIIGDLIRSLLIQVQKAKVDSELAISALDKLLRANELNFAILAVIPSLYSLKLIKNVIEGTYSRFLSGIKNEELINVIKKENKATLTKIERMIISLWKNSSDSSKINKDLQIGEYIINNDKLIRLTTRTIEIEGYSNLYTSNNNPTAPPSKHESNSNLFQVEALSFGIFELEDFNISFAVETVGSLGRKSLDLELSLRRVDRWWRLV